MKDQLGIEEDDMEDEEHHKFAEEILVSGTIVALAAEKKSMDTFYLIKISKANCASNDAVDDYDNKVKEGNDHLEGNFLEKISGSERIYKMSKKTFFYKESMVNPFEWKKRRKD